MKCPGVISGDNPFSCDVEQPSEALNRSNPGRLRIGPGRPSPPACIFFKSVVDFNLSPGCSHNKYIIVWLLIIFIILLINLISNLIGFIWNLNNNVYKC